MVRLIESCSAAASTVSSTRRGRSSARALPTDVAGSTGSALVVVVAIVAASLVFGGSGRLLRDGVGSGGLADPSDGPTRPTSCARLSSDERVARSLGGDAAPLSGDVAFVAAEVAEAAEGVIGCRRGGLLQLVQLLPHGGGLRRAARLVGRRW